MKKIACLTGTRADYGYLRPVMKEIEKNPRLELMVIATGMHFFKQFGNTIDEIKKDFPKVIEAPVELPEDSGYGTTKYISQVLEKISEIFKEIKPDFCLVLGDRTEIFAGVQAAFFQNIPIAHMHGGDVSSGWDEATRHSITKFAHIHFPATEKSAERIKKMGEQPWRIYTVGSSTLDEILNIHLPERHILLTKYNLNPDKPFSLIIQHSVTSQENWADEQMRVTLEAVLKTNLQPFVIYPNIDKGGQNIIKTIKEYEKKGLRATPNLPREDFLGLLKETAVLIGNSSSGIIESSSFKIPVINIGIRQNGRERGGNIIDVEYDEDKIYNAIHYVLTDESFKDKVRNCKNPYGDGKTGKRICDILEKIEINNELLQKRITY